MENNEHLQRRTTETSMNTRKKSMNALEQMDDNHGNWWTNTGKTERIRNPLRRSNKSINNMDKIDENHGKIDGHRQWIQLKKMSTNEKQTNCTRNLRRLWGPKTYCVLCPVGPLEIASWEAWSSPRCAGRRVKVVLGWCEDRVVKYVECLRNHWCRFTCSSYIFLLLVICFSFVLHDLGFAPFVSGVWVRWGGTHPHLHIDLLIMPQHGL